MPRICYVAKTFSAEHETVIGQANEIISSYQAQGYKLTLRQLYYQFVSRDLLPNTVQSYKRLGGIVNDARLAGRIDWNAIEDRTRHLESLSHWSAPSDIINSAAYGYRIDKWATQPCRVEVWIEKEALAGVFERVCEANDVPYLSCRGYTSQSEMWGAAMRLKEHTESRRTPGAPGQEAVILHFGDHDPSGIDMTRDIQDRLALFGARLELRRLALNMDQVETYNPPPNPAKESDSRFAGYIKAFGDKSWELDALEPDLLARLVQKEIDALRDPQKWDAALQREKRGKALLNETVARWDEVETLLGDTAEDGD